MAKLDRRSILELSAAALVAGLFGVAPARAAPRLGAPAPFSWDALQRRAAELAARPYAPRPANHRAEAIDFDAVGRLRYRPEATLAGGVRLFPLNRFAATPVGINLVEGGQARPLAFAPDLFSAPRGTPAAFGISGFRAMTPGVESDWLAFQGASYFRSSGAQDQYGLSARGIAIDTGIAGAEEFPAFTDFWIESRSPREYLIHALLDGPSVAGAYRFDCVLGEGGVTQDVSAQLFFRKGVRRLGLAPMTSMFWYGEGQRAKAVDWRPEIHDSDGLAMWTGVGERLWRPLVNPARDTLDSFADQDPRGFGLVQRDRAFASYQDDGAFYEKRPSLWVEPRGRWGRGAVALFAFPTTSETVDNVVAFWTPAQAPAAGARIGVDYRLRWTSADPSEGGVARAMDVWTGVAGRPGFAATAGQRKFVIDFAGQPLDGLGRDSGVEPVVSVGGGRLVDAAAYPVVGQRARWRVMGDVAPAGAEPADVRLFLRRGGAALSETVLARIG